METVKRLLELYRQMLRIRRVEERIAERYDEDRMKCPTHLSIGQEAAAVGMCAALTDQDVVYSTHRCHAHYLAKGGDMRRMVAELYGKETGCARGRGGSMHLIDVARGMYGASAIVDGSLPLALGAAQAFQLRRLPHVGVAFFGDAGVEPGLFHECMNYAALRKLPTVFFCENNDYSTMTRRHERQGVPIMERAAGYGVAGVRVDGNDLAAVLAVAEEAVARARAGQGPTLIEAVTYRWREHVEHNKAIMSRPAKELSAWQERCPLKRCREMLVLHGITPDVFEGMEQSVRLEVDEAFCFAEDSPPPAVAGLFDGVGDGIESIEEPSQPVSGRSLTMTSAIAEATVQAMEADPNVFVLGLHTTDPNGVFGTTAAAFKRFGPARVLETPISESALTGIATGAALVGMRPLHVHARNEFLLRAMSEVGNELAKWSFMSGGQLHAPSVIRAIIGRSRGQGCQHSQSLQSVFAHFPGLHVVAPSNAFDAKGLLLTALSGRTPVIYLEHRLCHPMTSLVPQEAYRIPFGKARIIREATDVTIVSVLHMVHEALRAADELARHGIEAEVIDLRSIRPWDKEAVCASVRKTGRLIVCDTGWIEFGLTAEICATVAEREFRSLKAAPIRIGLPACPTPMAEPLEAAFYPGPRDIVSAAFRTLGKIAPALQAGDDQSAPVVVRDSPF